jgi:Secretion system C-terminal sorting domain
MKKKLLIFLAISTFSIVFAKPNATLLAPAMYANLVTNSQTSGELYFTLTITNIGDEVLSNVQWSSPTGIIYFYFPQQGILGVGESIIVEGFKPFSGCSDFSLTLVSAFTVNGSPISTSCQSQYTSTEAAPQITSVITPDCYQVPVNGNLQITLSGLPSGNWTLHGNSASTYTYSGSGSTVVLNINSSIIGNNMRFYYDTPDGCSATSDLSQEVTINQIHNYIYDSPMNGSYIDANADGITNAGDQMYYQIILTNTRACPLNFYINGYPPTYTNPNLSFSGSPSTIIYVAGYTTYNLAANYIITAQDISNGSVTNSTNINCSWSDALGGSSGAYWPSCTTTLNVLSTNDVSFKNFIAYPNPVQDNWNITNGHSIEKVEIMTMLGQYVRTIMVHDLTTSIDLSTLSKGTYIARIYSGDKVKNVRIVKS